MGKNQFRTKYLVCLTKFYYREIGKENNRHRTPGFCLFQQHVVAVVYPASPMGTAAE